MLDLEDIFGHDGPLAAREGYEYREAQLQMAMAVGQTLERKRRLIPTSTERESS